MGPDKKTNVSPIFCVPRLTYTYFPPHRLLFRAVKHSYTCTKSAWRASSGTTDESWDARTSRSKLSVWFSAELGPRSGGGSSTWRTRLPVCEVFFNLIYSQHHPMLAQMQPANNKITYSHTEKNFNLTLDKSSVFQTIIACNFQHNHSVQWQTSKTEFLFSFRLCLFYNLEKPKHYWFW